ncbi:DUF6890 family protein [Pectobacterium versatile]|uniref:DUF6890 family protein n=1 Tax=Pectobacterium versatile TaxID=2488639 RepID=UPI00301A1929
MSALIDAIRGNQLEQYMTLRRHYLPHDDDDAMSLARAAWLAEYFHECQINSTAAGIAFAFNGSRE